MNSNAQSHDESALAAAAAWILRTGVVLSVAVMLLGILISFFHGTISVARMQSDAFDYHPSHILQGIATLHGKSYIEAGIYLLLLTPILRVAVSMLFFAFAEHDWSFTLITFVVLVLTVSGLIWLA
jgi:uncharacterized membrane protein